MVLNNQIHQANVKQSNTIDNLADDFISPISSLLTQEEIYQELLRQKKEEFLKKYVPKNENNNEEKHKQKLNE